jgi:hypothetical protein
MMRARALTIEGSFPAIAITAAPEAIFVFPTIADHNPHFG